MNESTIRDENFQDDDNNKDVFEMLNPKDGFHIIRAEVGESLSLACEFYTGGQQGNLSNTPEEAAVEIKEWLKPTAVEQGECTRLTLVLDSVARYLTTGGDWEELHQALMLMRKVALGGLLFPGYYYVDGYSTTDGTYQHIFTSVDHSGLAVLWEEPDSKLIGGFVDITTLEALRSQEDDGPKEVEADWEDEDDAPGEPAL